MDGHHGAGKRFTSAILIAQIIAAIIILGLIIYGIGAVDMIANDQAPLVQGNIIKSSLCVIW